MKNTHHKLNSINYLIAVSLIAVILFACKKEDDSSTDPVNNNNNDGKAKINVLLTDAPGDYKAVYVEIIDVQTNIDSSGWTSLDSINTGIFDLLKLTNGIDTLLGKAEIPAGKHNQIRLILGSNNSVVLKNNDSLSLSTPSGQQSGLKLKIKDELKAGFSYDILIDFDADKSVVKAGNSGKYNLKPVLRAVVLANTGSIEGNIQPDSIQFPVMAISGLDTFGTLTDSKGDFLIRGLIPGTYDVYIAPKTGLGLNDSTITGIGVTGGIITNMGIVQY